MEKEGEGINKGVGLELDSPPSYPWICPPEVTLLFRDKYQENLYNTVKEFIYSNKNTLLISGPPGSGKTYITIHSLLDNFDGKIIVILRTHSQQDHYQKLFGDDFLSIRGIEYHCQIQQVKLHPLKNQLLCRGCKYRIQFMEIPKHKVISFLYSHNAELIKNILNNLGEEYIMVFDEYHHCLPREQAIPIHFLQLASAEYGSKIDLNDSGIMEKIDSMKDIGEKSWRKVGYSYLLSLSEIIQYLHNKNRWFYKTTNGDIAYLDDSIYSLINTTNIKKIFISATPLPEIEGLLTYDEQYNIIPKLDNIAFIIYSGFKFNYETKNDEKVLKHIRKLLYHLGKYRTVIFFPSKSALRSVYPKLPENFTTDPSELPMKNTLLIAGSSPAGSTILCSMVHFIWGFLW
jgi:Rad3-related DNA helicase